MGCRYHNPSRGSLPSDTHAPKKWNLEPVPSESTPVDAFFTELFKLHLVGNPPQANLGHPDDKYDTPNLQPRKEKKKWVADILNLFG